MYLILRRVCWKRSYAALARRAFDDVIRLSTGAHTPTKAQIWVMAISSLWRVFQRDR